MADVELVRIPVASGGAVAAAVGGAGDPVVFEAGSPGDSRTWIDVTPLVRGFARTIAYNRAGYEPSEPCSWPRRLSHAADDLISVVRAATEVPAVIVAHSAGAVIARLALRRAAELFCGAVLVDPTPLCGLGVIARFERESPNAQREFDWDGGEQECNGLDEPGTLGATPLAVLWAGPDNIPDAVPAWYRDFFRDPVLRHATDHLSSRTRVLDLAHCSHNIPGEDPEAVASAVQAIVGDSNSASG